jgi:DNA-directed RNA polymerase subunit RPC12/RpoP
MNSVHLCPQCGKKLLFDKNWPVEQSVNCPECSYRGKVSDFPSVEMKAVFCPACKTSLLIRPDAKGAIVCPACKKSSGAGAYLSCLTDDVEKGSTSENDEIAGMYKVGKLRCVTGTEVYELKRGTNSMGRQHASSSASVQIRTDDDFMSRNHAGIDVVMNGDSTFSHILSDNGSRNGTFHNGIRLDPNDRIYLKPDDVVRLGYTVFKFIIE